MGLQGQLEEMPFVDILQLVAFSQKTGYLHLDSPLGRGSVVFRDGMVVCAYSWSTLDYVRRIAAGHYQQDQKDSVILALVETSLREMARLKEGSFRFELSEQIEAELEGVDISAFLLEQGINAQHLLLDLTRELDEDRRDTTARLESAFKAEPRPTAEAFVRAEPSASATGGPAEPTLNEPLPPGVLDEPDPSRTQRVPTSAGSLSDPLSTPLRQDPPARSGPGDPQSGLQAGSVETGRGTVQDRSALVRTGDRPPARGIGRAPGASAEPQSRSTV